MTPPAIADTQLDTLIDELTLAMQRALKCSTQEEPPIGVTDDGAGAVVIYMPKMYGGTGPAVSVTHYQDRAEILIDIPGKQLVAGRAQQLAVALHNARRTKLEVDRLARRSDTANE